ncbi:hypothetical protein CSOJ01_02063 [Colletotrichum sojae]|uniref:SprT-like domain-containing protein n=1 Tax=Colletotrichum sojae TaxID=2175907 RepID=A0A8H6JS99_9PEZI|nr:hypothetical protein CSOJ01_02063 [Colletotrichum sojae]
MYQPGSMFHLRRASYKGNDLLNFTSEQFCEGPLQEWQVKARHAFVECFLDMTPRAQAFEAKEYRLDLTGFNDDSEAASLDTCFWFLMKCLDDFFFGGNLTRFRDGSFLVHLLTPYDCTRGISDHNMLGLTRIDDPHAENADPYCTELSCQIEVYPHFLLDSRNPDKDRPWPATLETLVHEMVHAYINMFVCRGPQCDKNVLNTIGLTGHGPVFLKLHALLIKQMRTWHPLLKDLNIRNCLHRGTVDATAMHREEGAREAAEARGELAAYWPLKGDNRQTIVQLEVGHTRSGGIASASVDYRSRRLRVDERLARSRAKHRITRSRAKQCRITRSMGLGLTR